MADRDSLLSEVVAGVNAYIGGPSVHKQGVWLHFDGTVTLYVRAAVRYLPGRDGHGLLRCYCLDIAQIEIVKRADRGQGLGDAVIEALHASHPLDATRVECIVEPRYFRHLKRKGFLLVPGDNPEFGPSVYKWCDHGIGNR